MTLRRFVNNPAILLVIMAAASLSNFTNAALPISADQVTDFDAIGLPNFADIDPPNNVIDDLTFERWRYDNATTSSPGIISRNSPSDSDISTTEIKILTSDKSEFKAISIDYSAVVGGSPPYDLALYGYRDGVQIPSYIFNRSSITPPTNETLSLNWASVDEIRVTVNTDWIVFDNFAAGAAGTPATSPENVLTNFNQPSSGGSFRSTPVDWQAVPFTTDGNFTEFRSINVLAVTDYGRGLFFAEIWDVDGNGQPGSVVQVLNGPSVPNGLATYSADVSLSPNTQYFVVLGVRYTGSQVTMPAKDTNLPDQIPLPTYKLDSNRCIAKLDNMGQPIWDCTSPVTATLFPKLQINAEQPVPPPAPTYDLSPNPLFVDFSNIPLGSTSSPIDALLINNGGLPQDIGTLSVNSGIFNIVTDNCSNTTLATGANCGISVTFSPNHAGLSSALVTIPASAADPSSPYSLLLLGRVSEWSIGGAISGLSGSITIRNNGSDDLILNSNGAFSFLTAVAEGSTYSVSIAQQPTGQTCSVANGTGIVPGADVTNVTIDCVDDQYSVGGLLTGLVSGDSVVLQNNSGDDLLLTADGAFQFPNTLSLNDSYTVSVRTQPAAPSEQCIVGQGTGTITGSDISNISVTCTVNTFGISGSTTGLAPGESLQLQNNGADTLDVNSNGAFQFPISLADGTGYNVTISSQPATQTCTITNASGTLAGAAVSNISINCVENNYLIGGIVSGLQQGDTVILQNNASDDLPLSADGVFAFPTTLTSGQPYSVTVAVQPTAPSETCTVTNGFGAVVSSDINNVSVTCTLDKFFVGGALQGLAPGESVILENNGVDSLSISGDGSFTFSAPLADSSSYSVTVASQPAAKACTVSNASGAIGGSDITDVSVTCVDNNSPPDIGTPKPVPAMPFWLYGLLIFLVAQFGSLNYRRRF